MEHSEEEPEEANLGVGGRGLTLSLTLLSPRSPRCQYSALPRSLGHGWPLTPRVPGGTCHDSSSSSSGPENHMSVPGSSLDKELGLGH